MARILFISHTAEWTGPTHSLLLLLRHLAARFEPTVLLPGRGPFSEQLNEAGIRAVSLPNLGRRQLPVIRRVIARGGFDLVYGNNTSRGCRNALISAKLAGVPFVCHVRGMGKRAEWRKLGFLRFADAVIAVSEACARSISPYSGRQRLHVVYNGVDIPALADAEANARDAARRAAGLGPGVRLVVNVSHVCPRKGQKQAVEAMAHVVREVPSAHLLLVGALDRDPDYVDDVKERIRELGLEERVLLLGFRREIRELLGASEVFLHTAIEDPHPRAVIDAMAAGVPVVAFAVDGVKETVTPGTTGYLIPVGDVDELAGAVTKLLVDGRLRQELGSEGRRQAEERFSAAATAERIGEIIQLTLNRCSQQGQRRAREAVVG